MAEDSIDLIEAVFSSDSPLQIAQADVVAAKPAPGVALDAPATVPSLGGGPATVPVLGGDATVGAEQRFATAGYEMAGSGIGSTGTSGLILTTPTKGRPIRFDNGIFVYPAVTLGIGRNDNVAGAPTNEISSTIMVLRPEVVAELKRRGDRYTVSYTGNYGKYTSSSNDDFDHHDFWLGGDNYFTTRFRLGWGAGYLMRSDARGSTDRAGGGNEPDRWKAPIARVIGIYGAPKARGRIELESSVMQKRYTSNRAATIGSDLDTVMLAGRFYLRFMPKTALVLEARNTWNDYVLATSTNDNKYLKLLAGVTWEATAKTTGQIKLGRAYKSFDSAGRNDPSANSWEAGLIWEPRTYSKVTLETAQDISDSTGAGNFTDNRSLSLVWDHKWASYFTSTLKGVQVKSKYDGIARDDTTNSLGFGIYRELGYNFRIGVSHNYTKRESNDANYDFKRNVTMATLEIIL